MYVCVFTFVCVYVLLVWPRYAAITTSDPDGPGPRVRLHMRTPHPLQAAAARHSPYGATGSHMADLDEGNEMMDSLLRMSGDGGGGDGVDGDSARDESSLRRSGGGGGTTAAVAPAAKHEEKLPLLSAAATASSASGVAGAGSAAAAAAVAGATLPAAATAVSAPEKGRITVVEDRELGQVKWRVYGAYLSAFHWAAAVAMVLFWSVEQVGGWAAGAWGRSGWGRGLGTGGRARE